MTTILTSITVDLSSMARGLTKKEKCHSTLGDYQHNCNNHPYSCNQVETLIFMVGVGVGSDRALWRTIFQASPSQGHIGKTMALHSQCCLIWNNTRCKEHTYVYLILFQEKWQRSWCINMAANLKAKYYCKADSRVYITLESNFLTKTLIPLANKISKESQEKVFSEIVIN